MAKGASGRIVLEIDPQLKRQLYHALALEDSTLKDWFLENVSEFLADREQPRLPNIPGKKPRPQRQP